MISIKIDFKWLPFFVILFFSFTIIGTILHEYGHILVAKSFGYKTHLHYGSMNSSIKNEYLELNTFYMTNKSAIMKEENSIFKEKIEEINRKSFWITVGGPAQTILTGCLGLLILYFRRYKKQFNFIDWLAVFLSLFWLREVFNLITGILSGLFFKSNYFSGDEYEISKILKLPEGTFSIFLGFIGLLVSLLVVFKLIPKSKRFTFIFSGLIGGLSGFYIWYEILGPKLLP